MKTPEGDVERVNPRGTKAALGGIDEGRLVYQQYEKTFGKKGSYSTIRIYELSTGDRTTIEGIDTKRWEYLPSISGDWVSFGRISGRSGDRKLMLYNLATGDLQNVASSVVDYYLQPGQLNGSWVTWVEWTGSTFDSSNVQVYNLETQRSYFVGGGRKFQWAPSVSGDGMVYALTTGKRCGSRPHFVRFAYDEEEDEFARNGSAVIELPEGKDSSHSYVYVDQKGKVRLMHERFDCDTFAADVLEVVDSYKLTVMKEGSGSGTVSSSPPGIACGNDCEEIYSGGTRVTLTADPGLGSTFGGWSGACEGEPDPCTVTMNDARSVTATFNGPI